jgi:hypothetical protein
MIAILVCVNKFTKSIIYVGITLSILGCNGAIAEPTRPQSKILINPLLTEIQRALVRVQNSTEKAELPPLESVELSLSTQFIKDKHGKLDLYIVSLGGIISKDATHLLILRLKPPERGTPLSISGESLSQQLSDAIIVAAKAAFEATKREPPLLLDNLAVHIKFVITQEAAGGLEFSIKPISIDIGGKLSGVDTQEITVTFQKQS